jgi:hypothetical protein
VIDVSADAGNIGGVPLAFVVTVDATTSFEAAVLKKIILEVAGRNNVSLAELPRPGRLVFAGE